MIPVLALDMGSPLMLMFGIVVAAGLGGAAGFVLGTSIGRTAPETPLPTTIRMTRDRLSSAMGDLESASAKLNASYRSDLAGEAAVLSRRLSEMSEQLGRIQVKAKYAKEGSA